MIMLQNLFRSRSGERPVRVGDALYALAVDQARAPAFYTTLGVADRIDARFELYTLHILLLVMRLRDGGERGADAGQALFDTYVSALDNALRELGVGDFGISRRIKAMAGAFYGRLQVYGGAASTTARAEAILKNLYRGEEERRPEAAALAHYIELVRHALLERTDLLLQGKPELGPLPQIRVSS